MFENLENTVPQGNDSKNEADIEERAESIGASTEAEMESVLSESMFYDELAMNIQDLYARYQKDIAMRMPLSDFLGVLKAKKEELSQDLQSEDSLNENFFIQTMIEGVQSVFARNAEDQELNDSMELEDFLGYLRKKSVITG